MFHTTTVAGTRPKSPLPTAKKELINHSKVRGIDILRDPKLNKVCHYFTLWQSSQIAKLFNSKLKYVCLKQHDQCIKMQPTEILFLT